MAKGESKVEKKEDSRQTHPPARDEVSPKIPQNSSQHSAFQNIPQRTFRKLLHPNCEEKAGISRSDKVQPSMLPPPGDEPESKAAAPQPGPQNAFTSGQCTRIDDSQASLKDEKNELLPAEGSVTQDPSHRSKAVKGKAESTVDPITTSLNDMNVYQYGQVEIASVLTSTRSTLTQELLLFGGSDTTPELLFKDFYNVQAKPEHSTLSGEERNQYIADLVDVWIFSETNGYISSREMSLKLDQMASQTTTNDDSFPRRSLTPSLGASTSFLQLLADTTFSATERSGLIRINVAAWIFTSLSKSRLDGLRCIFVVDHAMSIESALRCSGPALKPARLARLVEDHWFMEPSARGRPINEHAASVPADRALSNRPLGSLPEPGSSTKPSRSSPVSMSPTFEDANAVDTKPAGASEIVPEEHTDATYPKGEQILNTVATQQQRGVYDHLKHLAVSTTKRLTDGAFEQMFSWFGPGPKQPPPMQDIAVEINPGETLTKGSRLNLNKLKSIEWTTKIKDVGRVIGEQSIRNLRSNFKSEIQIGEECDVDDRGASRRAEANAEQIPNATNSSDIPDDYALINLSEAHEFENEPVATETVSLQTVPNVDSEQTYFTTIRSYYAKTTRGLYNLATILGKN